MKKSLHREYDGQLDQTTLYSREDIHMTNTKFNWWKERRFWPSIAVIPEHECHEWIGARHRFGYGRVQIRGKTYLAHRLSWIIHKGSIPKGNLVLHKCDNPSCVRIEHLFVGTQRDNVKDMISKGRDRF